MYICYIYLYIHTIPCGFGLASTRRARASKALDRDPLQAMAQWSKALGLDPAASSAEARDPKLLRLVVHIYQDTYGWMGVYMDRQTCI